MGKQTADVLHWLLRESITQKEAWESLGVANLSSVINKLKKSKALDDIGIIRKAMKPVTWDGIGQSWIAEYYIERRP